MLAPMSATPRLRRALALALPAVTALATLFAGCARARREGAWVDTTPNGFVAAPVDPPADAGAFDAAAREASAPR
jgi:hypothetical protein